MKRADALSWMRVAGYHGDRSAYTRLLIEERVSKARGDEAFRAGAAQRAAGVPCSCSECQPRKK